MAYGALFSLAVAVLSGAEFIFPTTPSYTLSLLYLAIIGSSVAFGSYLSLVRNIGADKAAYSAILFPIVALILSSFFEGYMWTPLSIMGMALSVLGNVIAMTNLSRLKAKTLFK